MKVPGINLADVRISTGMSGDEMALVLQDSNLVLRELSNILSVDQNAMDPATVGSITVGNIARRMLDGRMGTFDNGTTKTFHAAFEVPLDFDAARVILVNSNTATYSVASVCFVSIDSTSNLSGIGLNWTDGTFAGSAGCTVPAAANSASRAYAKSDWCQVTNQGRLKIIAVRVEVTTAGTINVMGNGIDSYTNWASRTDGHIVCLRNQSGSFATAASASGFSSTTNTSQSPICGVEVSCRGRVLNLGVLGDSTDEGRGTYIGESWGLPTSDALSADLGIPVVFANMGWASQSMANVYRHVQDIVTYGIVPDLLFIPAGSINDLTNTINSTMIKTCRTNIAAALATLHGSNNPPRIVLRNIEPVNPSVSSHNHDSSDSLRVSYNTELSATSYGANGFAIFDFSGPLSGITDADGQVNMAVGVTTDGIHPNDTGNAAVVANAVSAAKRALGIPA